MNSFNDYKEYTEQDFMTDDLFRRWIFENTPEDEEFWQNWLKENPNKIEVVNRAQLLLTVLKYSQFNLDETEINEATQEIVTKANALKNKYTKRKGSSGFIIATWKMVAAASVIVAIAIGMLYVLSSNEKQKDNRISYQKLVATSVEKLTERVNTSDKIMTIKLNDGSIVHLTKNSRVSFPAIFSKEKRKIILMGEAFFEVAKNPYKPFEVHSNEIVVRVLGTSFNVKAYDLDKNIVVSVKKGKVSVYAEKELENNTTKNDEQSNIVVLTPNQQAVYSRGKAIIRKTIVENPLPLEPSVQKQSLVFEDTPVGEVFTILEKLYGIKIVYDEQVISKCLFHANLSKESLNEQLKLICKTINGSYEEMDGQIIISAKGCIY